MWPLDMTIKGEKRTTTYACRNGGIHSSLKVCIISIFLGLPPLFRLPPSLPPCRLIVKALHLLIPTLVNNIGMLQARSSFAVASFQLRRTEQAYRPAHTNHNKETQK